MADKSKKPGAAKMARGVVSLVLGLAGFLWAQQHSPNLGINEMLAKPPDAFILKPAFYNGTLIVCALLGVNAIISIVQSLQAGGGQVGAAEPAGVVERTSKRSVVFYTIALLLIALLASFFWYASTRQKAAEPQRPDASHAKAYDPNEVFRDAPSGRQDTTKQQAVGTWHDSWHGTDWNFMDGGSLSVSSAMDNSRVSGQWRVLEDGRLQTDITIPATTAGFGSSASPARAVTSTYEVGFLHDGREMNLSDLVHGSSLTLARK